MEFNSGFKGLNFARTSSVVGSRDTTCKPDWFMAYRAERHRWFAFKTVLLSLFSLFGLLNHFSHFHIQISNE